MIADPPACTCAPVISVQTGRFTPSVLHAEQCAIVRQIRIDQAPGCQPCDCAIGAAPYTGDGPRHTESCAMIVWDRAQRAKLAAPHDAGGQAVQEWAARRREQAAQAARTPARPSPRTARCIGCRGTGQGVPAPQSHARVCPDYTQEDEAWCLTKYWADNRGTMISYEEALESVRRDSKYARYAPPSKDGVGSVQVKVGEQADICSCEVSRLVHDPKCPAYGPVPRPLVAAPDQPAR